MLLTLRYEREEILRHYLRLVPCGNQIYGTAYAAERYFDKPVEDLSWAEIALLHFSVPNHGKLWKSLMTAHLGDYQTLERRLGARQQ